MNEANYNLLLTGAPGYALFGTLRVHFTGAYAHPEVGERLLAAGQAHATPTIELAQQLLEGDIIVPALAGLRRLALRGIGYGTAAGPVWQILQSALTAPRVMVQFNFSDNFQITGGVTWAAGPGAPAPFAMLGTQLPHRAD